MSDAPIVRDLALPERLPGEPARRRAAPPVFLLRLVLRTFTLSLVLLLTAGLWPIYLLSALIWGWPPTAPRRAQFARYLRYIWTAKPSQPELDWMMRCWLTLGVGRKFAELPFWGLCWQLDELLYGRALDRVAVTAPLIEISAARSGSTQLARYLEEDPHLVAPSLLQSFMPYLWLWRLAPRTLGRLFTPAQVQAKLEELMPSEFLERHEGDPFRTDTFDIVLLGSQLHMLSTLLGPEVMSAEFNFGRLSPQTRAEWEEDFVEILDRIARKTLLNAAPGPDGAPRRFFVKGHFLAAAEALARRYPDARFLTMVREPAPRLQSAINFMRANPTDGTVGPVPWGWLVRALTASEADYCRLEQAWFSRPEGPRRTVVRFHTYLRDLEGTMARVYRACLDLDELPAHVPRVHPPRERTNYQLNRSLAQLGVDEEALNASLADYVAWCREA